MTRCGYPYASVLGLMNNYNAFVVCNDNLAGHQIGTRLNSDMRSNASRCCGLDAPLANPLLAPPNGLSYSWPPTYRLSNYGRDQRCAATLISFHSKLVCNHELRCRKRFSWGCTGALTILHFAAYRRARSRRFICADGPSSGYEFDFASNICTRGDKCSRVLFCRWSQL